MKKINMKKIVLLLSAVIMIASCQNKDLGELEQDGSYLGPVEIIFDWLDKPSSEIPTKDGMRVNIFAIEEGVFDYGVDDIGYMGGVVKLLFDKKFRTLSYSYHGNNIYFRNESDPELIEAYCNTMNRATYSRSYPDEATYTEPQGFFYVGKHDMCHVVEGAVINIIPESRIYTYTFEVRGVKGAEYISETRGAISGMSSSFFIGLDMRSQTSTTLLFNASVDKENEKIVGSFRTFGRLETDNFFTIEVLYPSKTNNGIIQCTWDVTPQIDDNKNYHIIIENSGIEIPDEDLKEEEGDDSGWKVDLGDWNDEEIILN